MIQREIGVEHIFLDRIGLHAFDASHTATADQSGTGKCVNAAAATATGEEEMELTNEEKLH